MKAIPLVFAVALLMPTGGLADEKTSGNHEGMKHSSVATDDVLPAETGQSAFAAIQEIVALLEANPRTDWSKVNIESLRQHLIDMNNVTMDAVVVTSQTGDGLQFSVSGEGAVAASIRRMIMGHVKTMNGVDGWKFTAEPFEKGAVMSVTPPGQISMSKLRALGFIGIMTRGMHHQQHHWMLANDMEPHK
jgi:hypothetical protein